MAHMLMSSLSGIGGYGPLCVTYTYPNQVTELRCDSTTRSQLQVAWTYAGFLTPILLPRVLEQYTSFVYNSVSTGTQLPPSSTSSAAAAMASLTPASLSTSSSTYSSSTSASASDSSAAPTTIPTRSASASNVGAIAGGAVGGVAAVVVALGVILLLRRRRWNNSPHSVQISQPVEAPDSSRPTELYNSSKASRNPVELQG
jgi:hypothetical protein